MPTDSTISGLPAIPAIASNDVIEILDVSDTTNQPTGENTKATVAQLLGGIPAFVAAGAGHAAGLVPDPGASAHVTPYILGDDGLFHPVTGAGVSYGGGEFTFTGGGGATSPGGSDGQIQYRSAGSFAGAAKWAIGSTSGELVATQITDPTVADNQLWASSSTKTFNISRAGVKARLGGVIWSGKDGTAIANTTTPTSIFSGATAEGSLSLDPTKLAINQYLEFHLAGLYGCTASSPTAKWTITINGTVVGQGIATTLASANTAKAWTTYQTMPRIYFRTISGASSKVFCNGLFVMAGAGSTNHWISADGLGSAVGTYGEVTVDLSSACVVDVKFTWGTQSSTNTLNLFNGDIELKG